MFIYRGNGYLAPLVGVGALVMMIPAKQETVRVFQSLVVVAWLVGGAWVVWYGIRSLLAAERELGRPLAWFEWVFDPVLWKPRPFHSFMLIQMPWWGLAFAAAIIAMVITIAS